MTPETEAKINSLVQAIAALLHQEALATVPEKLTTLEGSEVTVRQQVLEYISPQIALFLSPKRVAQLPDNPEN